jgi:hypothetical protein
MLEKPRDLMPVLETKLQDANNMDWNKRSEILSVGEVLLGFWQYKSQISPSLTRGSSG